MLRTSILCVALAVAVTPPVALAQAAPQPAPASPPAQPADTKGPAVVKGVTVTANTGGFKSSIDRRSYDLTTDLQATHGSIADALRNVPSVDVDLQGNVSLRGDRVVIMVDGKPSGMFSGPAAGQLLQTLPADQFERVEVITNPTAEMAPDGVSGIINLISKKKRKIGASGSLRGAMGTGGRWNTGVTGAWNNGKLTLSGDAALRGDDQFPKTIDQRTDLDAGGNPVNLSRAVTRGRGHLTLWTARLGADYNLTDKDRISAQVRANDFRFGANNPEELSAHTPSGVPTQQFDRTGRFDTDRSDTEGSLTWIHNFDKQGQDLTVSLTRSRTGSSASQEYQNTVTLPVASSRFNAFTGDGSINHTELKADYVRPFQSGAKLKLGYDLIDDRSDYDNSGQVGATAASALPDPTQTDLFRFGQRIEAAYATFEQPLGKLTVLGGLRVEQAKLDINSITTAQHVKNDYSRVYPSLHLGWKLDDHQDLTLSYSERVQRPTPQDLNPFRVVADPFHIAQGNPNLQPQETHSYEAGYQYKQGQTYYLATLYYRQNEKGVTDLVTDLGGGVQLSTRENLASSRFVGLELVASGHVTKALSYNVSSNLYWNEIDPTGLPSSLGANEKREAASIGGRGNLTWQATPNDTAQLNASIIGKRLTPQGYISPMPIVNIGYRHKFNDQLSLFVTAQDALASYKAHEVIVTPTFREQIDNRARTQAAFVGLTWTFGNGPKRDPGFDYSG
ncbi:MAG: TonB-dependent receptor [Proteobacteria bacterium]|nr:TonB-dependent receptor [Pseudomonadota bacterium]